jgi:PhnB protein
MQFQPYLVFDGNCAQAMQFYERVIGGKLEVMMKIADAPERCGELPPGSDDRIMHARLVLDDSILMASDSMLGQPYEGMKNFSVALTYPTADAAKPVFDALAEGGQVMMPLGKTFWADAFGMLTDRFGTPWMINGGLQDV